MIYSRLQNRQAVLQGLNDYYTEIEEPEEIQEMESENGFWVQFPYKPSVGEYFWNESLYNHYLASDGMYHRASDYGDEWYCDNGLIDENPDDEPVSGAVASYLDGLTRDDWGTVISEVNKLYGLRYCHSYMEAERIQRQYEAAIGRTSTYRGDVENHVLKRYGIVWEPIKRNYLVGQERWGVFCVSHFAPSSIRKGMEMMKSVLHHSMPVCIATLPYQANMLKKIGFHEVGYAPQWFAGEIHMKTVLVNDAVDVYTVKSLLDTIGEYIN